MAQARDVPKLENVQKDGVARSSKAKLWMALSGLALLASILCAVYLLDREPSVIESRDRLDDLNVILITVDTLRADFVGASGKGRATTPHLDRLAEEGVWFERCIAQVPLTLPSHTTILSGTYPLRHRVRDNGGFMVPSELRFVSEVLQERGFRTAAFVSAFVLHSKWGINQGFDTYSDDFDRTQFDTMALQNSRPADAVLDDAETWLRTNKTSRFFTWIHLFEPHSPYAPPSPYDRYPDEPYRGEVEYVDQALGDFIDFLEEEGLYDKSLIIVTSDHGEGLGQHGEQEHGYFVYEPTVHVPLIVRAPMRFPVPRVPGLVELVDLSPTILDALGIAAPDSYQGESLLGLMYGDEPETPRTAYTESFYPRLHYGWSELRALYRDGWKYIWAPDEELYALDEDPEEQENLREVRSSERTALSREIRELVESQSTGAASETTTELDREDRRRLEALGYMTGGATRTADVDLPDPKSKFAVANDLARAGDLADAHRCDEAMEILNGVIAAEPDIARAHAVLGGCYQAKRMYREALTSHRRVLELKPDDNFTRFDVVATLVNLGAFDDAIREATAFLEDSPEDHDFLELLGLAYFYKEDYDRAIGFLEESIAIEESSSALSKLGEIRAMRKELTRAAHLLKRALEINPNSEGAHYGLALIAESEGDADAAMEHYAKELENNPSDYRASFNLADHLMRMGRRDEAIAYYRRTIDANPTLKAPYFLVAQNNVEQDQNLDEAIELCKKGIRIEPRDQVTLLGYQILTEIYAKQRDRKNFDFYLAEGEKLYRTLDARGQIAPPR